MKKNCTFVVRDNVVSHKKHYIMYKAMSITMKTLEKKGEAGMVEIVMVGTKKPKELEETIRKEESIQAKLMKIAGKEWGEEDIWTRIVTNREVEMKNLHIVKRATAGGECYGFLAEGPTKKKERELWNRMTRDQKASWIEGIYMGYQGENRTVTILYERAEIMQMMEELDKTGIIATKM